MSVKPVHMSAEAAVPMMARRPHIFAQRLLCWLMRHWAMGQRDDGAPPALFWQAFRCIGGHGLGLRLDVFLSLVCATAPHRPRLCHPRCVYGTADEVALLASLAAWQADDPCAAQARLAPIVAYAEQSAALIWAGRECAAALLLADLHLPSPVLGPFHAATPAPAVARGSLSWH
ncbi:MAG: hypothetical protein ACOY99_11985 [Pseudomonadota bacterium]